MPAICYAADMFRKLEEAIHTKATAGEDLPELHAVVVHGEGGHVYRLRGVPTSVRGLNVTRARKGEEVLVVWGVVHDAKLLAGTFRLSPAGKGALAHYSCTKLLVEAGYYTELERWDELNSDVQEAWKVIGADWYPDELVEAALRATWKPLPD